MNKLLLFLVGSIGFTARGGFSERFLNLCRVNGVKLYDLHCKANVLYARTTLHSFRKIRRCATRSGMRVKICEKRGLPFLYAKLARRSGLFFGIALCAFLLFFYSRSVWSIEVKGNERISGEQVIQVLAQNGVEQGTLKNTIDSAALRYALYDEIPEIAWLNIGIDGSKLTVNLREVTQKPAQRDAADYCNILAAKGGVIDKIQVYEGEGLVHEGDGVSEGQMLVSGIIFHEQAKRNTFHRSSADIFAFTECTTEIRVPKSALISEYTGRQQHYRVLHIFRFRIPLYLFCKRYQKSELSKVERPLVICQKVLPVSLEEYVLKELSQKHITRDARQAAALLRSQKAAFEKGFREGTKILGETTELKAQKDAFVYTLNYELYENIAKEAPIEIDDKNVNNNIENSAQR